MTCLVCALPSTMLYRDACERCNTIRLRAAREFIHAAEAVRLMSRAGMRVTAQRRRPPIGRNRLEHAVNRLHRADQECVRLLLWPAERSTIRPPWFYGDERSNTA
jgi:hypothetical protein